MRAQRIQKKEHPDIEIVFPPAERQVAMVLMENVTNAEIIYLGVNVPFFAGPDVHRTRVSVS